MDRAKLVVKSVIAAGLVWVWPGPVLMGGFGAPAGIDHGDPRPASPRIGTRGSPAAAAADWFRSTRSSCNAVEVDTRLRRIPPPDSFEGHAYEAACLALAGRLDHAKGVIEALPAENRWRAAGIVFDQAHGVADAGDDVAAGPVMELVLDFWPNHYMALYHAGAWRYAAGDADAARAYLDRFLDAYDQNDGWTRNAREMLARLPDA